MIKTILSFLFLMISPLCGASPVTEFQYLSGKGKDDAVEWDFLCTAGRKSGEWSKIPVPSHWEQHGFGGYYYGRQGSNRLDEIGKYKRTITIPDSWGGKRVRIVFEGVMTDTEVRVNGKAAGPVHQGGFYRFHYDITDLLKKGDNLLEVTVKKVSANATVEAAERKADYWVFGGIYRPVYLEALPSEFIDWMSVDAKADESFVLDVHAMHLSQADRLVARIVDAEGRPVGDEFSADLKQGADMTRLSTQVEAPALWSAETPNLYHVQVTLCDGEREVHQVTQRFGFRTFEVREGEGLFLNGRRIWLKGVNRHCFWPDSGRCLTREISYDDAQMIKEMNMNAVRCAHYPPDVHFLEACDELGLYVLNELCTWQKPTLDTPTAERLVAQMVKRDQMHPSILFWCNGNEDGWNTDVDDDYAKYDIQNRTVLHPRGDFNGINTQHYMGHANVAYKLKKKILYMPTEILHGIYDCGHGAGLDDYWQLLGSDEHTGGGMFLWNFSDEGLARTDNNGAIDTAGSHAPDGITGPYREREGSFYSIREIWSPVQIPAKTLGDDFDGTLEVENTYSFLNLNSCTFRGEIIKTSRSKMETMTQFKIDSPDVGPRQKGRLRLQLPSDWSQGDILSVTATDCHGRDLVTRTWSLRTPADRLNDLLAGRPKGDLTVTRTNEQITVGAGHFAATFDARTGLLQGIRKHGKLLPLANGPRLVPESQTATQPEITINEAGDHVALTVRNPSHGLESLTWKIHSEGYLEMKCAYLLEGEHAFHGVTFDFPEKEMKAKTWLGDGPYRVWQNRMKGPTFGRWETAYNDTETGMSWIYPEFKGYFSHVNWMEISSASGPLTVATDQQGLFVRILEPKVWRSPTFPGDLSFLRAIPATNSKFIGFNDLGPQSKAARVDGEQQISLYFE